jgi:hypothetical protein
MDKKYCAYCGKLIEEETFEGLRDIYCSEDCRKEAEPRQVCYVCENWEADTRWYGGAIQEDVCDSCAGNIVTCDNCGDYCWDDSEFYTDDGRVFCSESCLEEILYRHSDCVRSYGYKPEPIFYGKTEGSINRFYGVECELDTSDGNPRNYTEEAIDELYGDYVYMKYDGSLSNGGVEIVSHPMTLDFHKNNMEWRKLLTMARNDGLESMEGAGFHIHVNKDSFTNVEKTQANLARIFRTYWEDIVDISRRESYELDDWAGRPYFDNVNQDDDEIIRQVIDDGRYTAVNLCNTHTVEIRVFASVDNFEDFLEALNFVDNVVEVADTLDWADIENMTFEEILNYKNNKEILNIA